MGYSETPFCYQGAIIYDSDFDGNKLLRLSLKNNGTDKAIIDKILKYDDQQIMSDEIKNIIADICVSDELQTLAEVKEELTEVLPRDIVSECIMDTLDFDVRSYDSGDSIVFISENSIDKDIDFCYFITLENPMRWKHNRPARKWNVRKIIKCLKKGTTNFLKDDIEWSKRLGVLSGIYND